MPAIGLADLLEKVFNSTRDTLLVEGHATGTALPTVPAKTVSATPAVTAGAYSAKDAVGGLLTFTNVARATGGTVKLQSLVVIDKSVQAANLVLVLFDRTFTAMADNAAFDPSDADLANVIAVIEIATADYKTFTDNCVATKTGLERVLTLSGTSLFGQLYAVATPTYESTSDLTIKLGIEQH